MKSLLLLIILIVVFLVGCSGTGFEKRSTLMPNSVTIGYMQEQFKGDTNAWNGVSISGTWEFK